MRQLATEHRANNQLLQAELQLQRECDCGVVSCVNLSETSGIHVPETAPRMLVTAVFKSAARPMFHRYQQYLLLDTYLLECSSKAAHWHFGHHRSVPYAAPRNV